MTPLIFLDIDGVLNTIHSLALFKPVEFHPPCVAYLNQLINLSGAEIVVSSTWRLGQTVESMQAILSTNGVVGRVVGVTPDCNGAERWVEVQEYLEQLPDCHPFVILDDNVDFIGRYRDRLVHTSFAEGLTASDVLKALAILKSQA